MNLSEDARADFRGRVESVDWSTFAQPGATLPGVLLDFDVPARAWSSRLRWAIGNAHAGTYLPVVLPVLALVRQLLTLPCAEVRLAAVDFLIDVGVSWPDVGFDFVDSPFGNARLRDLVLRELDECVPYVRPLMRATDREERELAELFMRDVGAIPESHR